MPKATPEFGFFLFERSRLRVGPHGHAEYDDMECLAERYRRELREFACAADVELTQSHFQDGKPAPRFPLDPLSITHVISEVITKADVFSAAVLVAFLTQASNVLIKLLALGNRRHTKIKIPGRELTVSNATDLDAAIAALQALNSAPTPERAKPPKPRKASVKKAPEATK